MRIPARRSTDGRSHEDAIVGRSGRPPLPRLSPQRPSQGTPAVAALRLSILTTEVQGRLEEAGVREVGQVLEEAGLAEECHASTPGEQLLSRSIQTTSNIYSISPGAATGAALAATTTELKWNAGNWQTRPWETNLEGSLPSRVMPFLCRVRR